MVGSWPYPLERPVRDKYSSLLQPFVNYRRKMFYNIWSRRNSPLIRAYLFSLSTNYKNILISSSGAYPTIIFPTVPKQASAFVRLYLFQPSLVFVSKEGTSGFSLG
jgi:hypothetical protein